jgi:hypothetical protein
MKHATMPNWNVYQLKLPVIPDEDLFVHSGKTDDMFHSSQPDIVDHRSSEEICKIGE